jgi:hypothetical protein
MGAEVVEPRFLLVVGERLGTRLAPPWPGLGRSLVSDDVPRSWTAWRLVGNNHRELARSAGVFPAVDGCLADIAELRTDVDRGTVVVEALLRGWTWRFTIGDRLVAVASRLYQRQRECEYSVRSFVTAVPLARVPVLVPKAPEGGPIAQVVFLR